MTKRRNIILIGKTGNGKSTLANVLVNEGGDFKEVFGESDGLESFTKEYKYREFENNGIKYTITDTPGICDTNDEDEKKIYEEIVKAIHRFSVEDEGLNQVLFVTRGRFTKEEEKAYDLLWDAFFNEGIIEYTTIVRTNFPKFKNIESCKNDIEQATGKIKEVINSCKGRVIHVENYPDDEEKRKASRDILLEHLAKCRNVYRHKVSDISSNEYEEIEDLKIKIEEIRNKLKKDSKNIKIANDVARTTEKVGGAALASGPVLHTVGAFGALTIATSKLTKIGTKYVQGWLTEKHKKSLKKIIERVQSFSLEAKKLEEKKDFKALEKLSDEYIIELGEKLKTLKIKLEIREMFAEYKTSHKVPSQ